MDKMQIWIWFQFLIVCILSMSYPTIGRIYSTGRGSVLLRNEEQLNVSADGYISNLWNSVLYSNKQGDQSKAIFLTPNGSPGPAILKIFPKPDSLTKHPLTILSSGNDDDPGDLNTSNGKIITMPDFLLGPLSVLKSPGTTSSLIVSNGKQQLQTRSNSFSKTLQKTQKQTDPRATGNNAESGTRDGYVGPLTSMLADTLCPICRRLSNRRLMIACLMRYCYENPNIQRDSSS